MRGAVGAAPAWFEPGRRAAWPDGQGCRGVCGSAESPAGVDEPGDVVAVGVGVLVDGVGGEPGAGVAGGVGAFGSVFGQVAGGHLVGDLAPAGEGDGADLQLAAPGNGPAAGTVRVRRAGEGDVSGGVLDRRVQV